MKPSTENLNAEELFVPDNHPPIKSRSQDLLGRASFSESLADSIRGHRLGGESYVIALYGEWGSGKSSIKNMIVDALHETPETCPGILEFNPWQWMGHEQLSEAFFQELKPSLNKTKSKKLISTLKLYSARLKFGHAIFGATYKLTIAVLIFLGTIGFTNSIFQLPIYLRYTLAPLMLVAVIIGVAAMLFEKAVIVGETRLQSSEKSLSEIKEELRREFSDRQKVKKPILVIIDDIDRLSSAEIKNLFQLIKANADFPNLIYLLLFQRELVAKALQEDTCTDGNEFLEKIIQVGLHVPQISLGKLNAVIDDVIDSSLLGISCNNDERRWFDLFDLGIKPYLSNLRKVYLFGDLLAFHINGFNYKGSFEVNGLDLLAITALEVFEPDIFRSLTIIKTALLGTFVNEQDMFRYIGNEQEKDEARKREILKLIESADNKKQVQIIIKELFPLTSHFLGSGQSGKNWESWLTNRRVCHPDLFDRYFAFSIPEGDISFYEIDEIIRRANDREFLENIFKFYIENDLISDVLTRLTAHRDAIDLDHVSTIVTAIFDVGDDFPSPISFMKLNPLANAVFFMHDLLKREGDLNKVKENILNATSSAVGIYLPLKFVKDQENRLAKAKIEDDKSIINETILRELKSNCVEKIVQAAESGQLTENTKWPWILNFWVEWDESGRPQRWIESLIKTKEGLFQFLLIFYEANFPSDQIRIKVGSIDEFISIDLITNQIEQLNTADLSDEQVEIISSFNQELAEFKKGNE